MRRNPKSIGWCLLTFLVTTAGAVAVGLALIPSPSFETGFIVGVAATYIGYFAAEVLYSSRRFDEWR